MERIIAPFAVAIGAGDLPPVGGVPGEATSGDPGAGVPATEWPAWIFNVIQKEIIAVTAAASIVLDRNNTGQLLAAIKELIQQETGNYAVDTGAANAYVIAPNPPIDGYTDGLPLRFKTANANTGASTVNVSTLGAKTIVRADGTALKAGDIPANGVASILFSTAVDKFFLISAVQLTPAEVQAQLGNYAVDTGPDGSQYICALTPALAAHSAGTPIRIKAAHSNTAAPTFNPGPGALAIVDTAGVALIANMIKINGIYELIYNGTNYTLMGAAPATTGEAKAQTNGAKYISPLTLHADRVVTAYSGALSASLLYSVAHGLPSKPIDGYAILECVTADLGFATGDRVRAPNGNDTTTNRGVTVAWGVTVIQGTVGSGGISISPQAGGAASAITLANWKMYLVAQL